MSAQVWHGGNSMPSLQVSALNIVHKHLAHLPPLAIGQPLAIGRPVGATEPAVLVEFVELVGLLAVGSHHPQFAVADPAEVCSEGHPRPVPRNGPRVSVITEPAWDFPGQGNQPNARLLASD